MKLTLFVLALAIAMPWGLLAAEPASLRPAHAHDHEIIPTTVSSQRWLPDAALRTGMRRAHQAVEELRYHEMGHMSASMVLDRANTVEQAVLTMFARCQLSAEPDAALHGILVPLLAAAKALKIDPQDIKAVADMRAALAHYPQYFNDPGWDQPVTDVHGMHDEP